MAWPWNKTIPFCQARWIIWIRLLGRSILCLMWHWFDLGKNRVSTSSRSPRFSRRFMCPLRQARRRPQLRCPSPISLPLAALWTAWGWIGFNVHVCFAALFVLKFKLDLKVGILIVPRFKHNENTDSVKSKLIQHVTSTGMWTKAGYNHTVHSTFVHVAKVYIARYHAFIKKILLRTLSNKNCCHSSKSNSVYLWYPVANFPLDLPTQKRPPQVPNSLIKSGENILFWWLVAAFSCEPTQVEIAIACDSFQNLSGWIALPGADVPEEGHQALQCWDDLGRPVGLQEEGSGSLSWSWQEGAFQILSTRSPRFRTAGGSLFWLVCSVPTRPRFYHWWTCVLSRCSVWNCQRRPILPLLLP